MPRRRHLLCPPVPGATTNITLTDGTLLGDLAWFIGNITASGHSDYGAREVATTIPNGNGLFDMKGNVSEWINDWTYIPDANPITDPVGGITNTVRDVRGGYWYGYPDELRSGKRYWYYPAFRGYWLGFRVVRSDL